LLIGNRLDHRVSACGNEFSIEVPRHELQRARGLVDEWRNPLRAPPSSRSDKCLLAVLAGILLGGVFGVIARTFVHAPIGTLFPALLALVGGVIGRVRADMCSRHQRTQAGIRTTKDEE
jgi:uncharacterized membrane protein YeaQ/YmgE (transglycosylase-associated protein family)